MNSLKKIWPGLLLTLLLLSHGFKVYAANSATCNLTINGTNYPVSANVQATSPSGLDFNINLSLPGSICQGLTYDVGINASNNLILGNNTIVVVTGTSPNYNINGYIPSGGASLPVAFKFRPGVTCNGERGVFTVTIKANCSGQTYSCLLTIDLTATATNTWSVKKDHLWGDLIGGQVLWKITLNNSNSSGIGTYDIASGRIDDAINCGDVVNVQKVVGNTLVTIPVTNLNTPNPYWVTGTVSCFTSQVEYIVTTVCCNAVPTPATNCAAYRFALGKRGPLVRPCDIMVGNSCASKPLVAVVGCSTPFNKSLTYGLPGPSSSVNYTQGCEGEYSICVSNSGNMPFTSLNITDIFPGLSQIEVQQVCVYSQNGANMNYNINFSMSSGGPTSGSGNVASNQCFNFTGPFPTDMTFATTSGSLTYGTICIRVRFKITAPVGTQIQNCATLNYVGSYNGQATNCGITFPPCTGTQKSCATFVVEAPKAVPGLRKCINGPQTYAIGQKIPFCITISNHGAAALTGFTLTDALGSPQNLVLDLSSVQYATGTDYWPGYTPCCPGLGATSSTPPTWVTANTGNLQNPSWAIGNLPGECRLDKASYLVIKFLAEVKPQNCGQNTNKAVLSAGSGTPLSYSAMYNVQCMGGIKITKSASGTFVNPPNPFQYSFKVENAGSVNMTNISVKDAFPACVRFICPAGQIPCTIYNASGISIGSANLSCNTVSGNTTFTVVPSTTSMAPGDYLTFSVTVTRLNGGAEPCCNPEASAYANVPSMGNIPIQDKDGPVCVQKSICCDIPEMIIQLFGGVPPFSGGYYNFGFNIFSWNLPIQEMEVSLMDVHFSYDFKDCKPASVGSMMGHLWTTTPNIGGGLNLSTSPVIANNALQWQAGTPVMFTGGQTVKLRIMRPNMLNIPCCKGKLYYCLKIRLKDVKCRVCEKIVCFSVDVGNFNRENETIEGLEFFEPEVIKQ